jgi:hypothetical protein
MRFKQQYTRDIDSIWEDAAQGGMAQYEHASSFYGIENNGVADEITDRRVRRDVLSEAHFSEIRDGRPTTIKSISTTTFQMSSADMQNLLLLNGAPNDARLKDGLWGPFSAGTSSGVGRGLGFTNVSTKGVNFGTLPNGKRGYRSVRVAPKAFVNTLINRASSRSGDVAAADCSKITPDIVRAVVRALGSTQISKSGPSDDKLQGAFRTQAKIHSLPVSVYQTADNGTIAICPRSTFETLTKKAAEMLRCTPVPAQQINAALWAFGHRDRGILKPGAASKPILTAIKNANTTVTDASLTKFRTEAKKRCGSKFFDARFKVVSGGLKDKKTVLVCSPECWTTVAQQAFAEVARIEKQRQARINKNFTKFIPVKTVQGLLRQCDPKAAKEIGLKSREFREGRFGTITARNFARVMKNLGFPTVQTILDTKKRNIRIKPQSAFDKLKKCAADEEAKRKRIIARRKAEAERKAREDLTKPEGQPMEPEPTPTDAEPTAQVEPDVPEDDFDTGPMLPADDAGGPGMEPPQEAGIKGAPALLAGLAAVALILFASQQRD